MDSIPPHIQQHSVPEPAMDRRCLGLCFLEVMVVVVDSCRGIHHRGHGAIPSRRIRCLRMGFIGSARTYRHADPISSTPSFHRGQQKSVMHRHPLDRGHATSKYTTISPAAPPWSGSANTPDPPAVFGKLRRKTPPKNFPGVLASLARLA